MWMVACMFDALDLCDTGRRVRKQTDHFSIAGNRRPACMPDHRSSLDAITLVLTCPAIHTDLLASDSAAGV